MGDIFSNHVSQKTYCLIINKLEKHTRISQVIHFSNAYKRTALALIYVTNVSKNQAKKLTFLRKLAFYTRNAWFNTSK
jgi:hypothetical protein